MILPTVSRGNESVSLLANDPCHGHRDALFPPPSADELRSSARACGALARKLKEAKKRKSHTQLFFLLHRAETLKTKNAFIFFFNSWNFVFCSSSCDIIRTMRRGAASDVTVADKVQTQCSPNTVILKGLWCKTRCKETNDAKYSGCKPREGLHMKR